MDGRSTVSDGVRGLGSDPFGGCSVSSSAWIPFERGSALWRGLSLCRKKRPRVSGELAKTAPLSLSRGECSFASSEQGSRERIYIHKGAWPAIHLRSGSSCVGISRWEGVDMALLFLSPRTRDSCFRREPKRPCHSGTPCAF